MNQIKIAGLDSLNYADFQYCATWVDNYNTFASTISFIISKHTETYHDFINKLENGQIINMFWYTDSVGFKANIGWRKTTIEKFHEGVDRITIRTLFDRII